jgi:hypothetical protein
MFVANGGISLEPWISLRLSALLGQDLRKKRVVMGRRRSRRQPITRNAPFGAGLTLGAKTPNPRLLF